MKQEREREGEWWMIVVGRGGRWMDGERDGGMKGERRNGGADL